MVECVKCGDKVEESEATILNGKWLCGKCFVRAQLVKCDKCGTILSTDDVIVINDKLFCPQCFYARRESNKVSSMGLSLHNTKTITIMPNYQKTDGPDVKIVLDGDSSKIAINVYGIEGQNPKIIFDID